MTSATSLRNASRLLFVLAVVAGLVVGAAGVGASASGQARTLTVDDDGTATYETIGAALDAATDGDTVEVRPGTYRESVTVDGNVTLVAPAGATLNGTAPNGSVRAVGVEIAGSAAPTVAGLTITGYDRGVVATGPGDWTVRNVTVRHNEGSGVVAARTTGNWTVRNTTIRDNGEDGIRAYNNDQRTPRSARGAWTVAGSVVRNNTEDGVEVYNASGAWTIRDTAIRANGFAGVSAGETSGDWRIVESTIRSNGDDGVTAFNATGAWAISDTTIRSNGDDGVDADSTRAAWTIRETTVRDSGDHGIDAAESRAAWIVANATVANSTRDGVFANATTGRWSVELSTVVDNGRDGVRAVGADPRGNATRNWWGDPGGPEPEDCVGNVTCADHLASAPDAGAGGTLSAYANARGVVTTDGLLAALADWTGGDLPTDLLRRVLGAWASGSVVG